MSERPVVNLDELEPRPEEDRHPEGYRRRLARVGPLLGAERLGATVYELDAGQSICPYHYEHGREEWLIVLTGSPLVRTPDGEQRLQPGDVACYPDGPGGAHKITNVAAEPLRVLMISTMSEPSLGVYPDSGKIGVWPGGRIFRLTDEVDYFLGETEADG